MAINLDGVDLSFSADGDYYLGEDGDLASNDSDHIQSIIEAVRTELSSGKGDWALHPYIGANLDDFIGESNSRVTADGIRSRIEESLSRPELIPFGDFEVKVVPVAVDKVLIGLKISAQATPNNSLINNETVISFLYNFASNNVTSLLLNPISSRN